MKKNCESGFHFFGVSLEDYDKPIWLVCSKCLKCGIRKSTYDYNLEKNGGDIRTRYESKMRKLQTLLCAFVMICLICSIGAFVAQELKRHNAVVLDR